MPAPPPKSPRDLLDYWKYLRVPAPRTIAETFCLLRLYDPAFGLEALLERVEFAGVTPRQVYHSAYHRAPERARLALARPEYDAKAGYLHALMSDEFQAQILWLFLLAFPEKRRILFVHIPKCAGTDLQLNLAPRFLSLPASLTAPAWTSRERLLDIIAGLSRMAEFVNDVFVYGHIPLNSFANTVGIRLEDQVFSLIRDPIDLMISQANYGIGLLAKDPDATRPDTREVLTALRMHQVPDPLPPPLLRDLALRALRSQQITRPNRICAYLGDGTAERAIENIVVHNVEITDLVRYPTWLSERWNINSSSRHNPSAQIISRNDVGPHLDYLRAQTAEDEKLFSLITRVLDSRQVLSLRGAELT